MLYSDTFFGLFWGYRGVLQTQDMLKRSIINKKSGKIPVHSWTLPLLEHIIKIAKKFKQIFCF